MNKEQVLQLLGRSLESGLITKNDLANILEPVSVPVKQDTSSKIVNVLYTIGGIVAVVGVLVLLSENWYEIGALGRILSTLGIGFVTFVAGLLMSKNNNGKIAQVMFAISAVLMPYGVSVVMHEVQAPVTIDFWIFITLSFTAIYAFATFLVKKNILFVLSLIYGSLAYVALLESFDIYGDVFRASMIILGASYILIAYFYPQVLLNDYAGEEKKTRGLLYAVGSAFLLGFMLAIGDIFNWITFLFIFGIFYGSVFAKSRVLLFMSAIFLVINIFVIYSEYFANLLSFPLMLIVSGFVIIGVGYGTLYINKNLLTNGQKI